MSRNSGHTLLKFVAKREFWHVFASLTSLTSVNSPLPNLYSFLLTSPHYSSPLLTTKETVVWTSAVDVESSFWSSNTAALCLWLVICVLWCCKQPLRLMSDFCYNQWATCLWIHHSEGHCIMSVFFSLLGCCSVCSTLILKQKPVYHLHSKSFLKLPDPSDGDQSHQSHTTQKFFFCHKKTIFVSLVGVTVHREKKNTNIRISRAYGLLFLSSLSLLLDLIVSE